MIRPRAASTRKAGRDVLPQPRIFIFLVASLHGRPPGPRTIEGAAHALVKHAAQEFLAGASPAGRRAPRAGAPGAEQGGVAAAPGRWQQGTRRPATATEAIMASGRPGRPARPRGPGQLPLGSGRGGVQVRPRTSGRGCLERDGRKPSLTPSPRLQRVDRSARGMGLLRRLGLAGGVHGRVRPPRTAGS